MAGAPGGPDTNGPPGCASPPPPPPGGREGGGLGKRADLGGRRIIKKKKNGAECFFFQAEDGIRDIGVTGVQTCALPIFGAAGLRGEQALVELAGDPEALAVGGEGRVEHGGVAGGTEHERATGLRLAALALTG